MVSQVGSMAPMPNYNNPLSATNTMPASNGSVFDYANPLATGTAYDNDMFMPDFLKTPVINGQAQQAQAQAQVQPQAQAQVQPQTQAQVQNTQADLTQQAPQYQQPVQTVSQQPVTQPQYDVNQQQVAQQPQYDVANPQQQTTATQNPQFTGSGLNGCLAEPQGDDVDYTKSGNPYKKASFGKKSGAVLGFLAPIASHLISGSKEWKQLFKTCPLLAIAGFGIGYLVDSCTEANRANAADAAAKQAKQSQILAQSSQQKMSAVA